MNYQLMHKDGQMVGIEINGTIHQAKLAGHKIATQLQEPVAVISDGKVICCEYPSRRCCWCDDNASDVIRYAGENHACCKRHHAEYSQPITYSNQDFDRINAIIR